jgi:hypothetical protein
MILVRGLDRCNDRIQIVGRWRLQRRKVRYDSSSCNQRFVPMGTEPARTVAHFIGVPSDRPIQNADCNRPPATSSHYPLHPPRILGDSYPWPSADPVPVGHDKGPRLVSATRIPQGSAESRNQLEVQVDWRSGDRNISLAEARSGRSSRYLDSGTRKKGSLKCECYGVEPAIRTVQRWVVLPIADLAWRLQHNALAHSKGAKCLIRSTIDLASRGSQLSLGAARSRNWTSWPLPANSRNFKGARRR